MVDLNRVALVAKNWRMLRISNTERSSANAGSIENGMQYVEPYERSGCVRILMDYTTESKA